MGKFMKSYTEIELRELDAWIAEHVMGWAWWRFNAPSAAVNSKTKRDKWCQLVPPWESWYRQPKYRGVQCNCAIEGMEDYTDLSIFKPSTDPAAAFQVLEKCADAIFGFFVAVEKRPTCYRVSAPAFPEMGFSESPTLPLAIALFAKQIHGG